MGNFNDQCLDFNPNIFLEPQKDQSDLIGEASLPFVETQLLHKNQIRVENICDIPPASLDSWTDIDYISTTQCSTDLYEDKETTFIQSQEVVSKKKQMARSQKISIIDEGRIEILPPRFQKIQRKEKEKDKKLIKKMNQQYSLNKNKKLKKLEKDKQESIQNSKKRAGRPFIFQTKNKTGTEGNVKEKRGIFRDYKQLYGKCDLQKEREQNTNKTYEQYILEEGRITKEELEEFQKMCRDCISYDYYLKKSNQIGRKQQERTNEITLQRINISKKKYVPAEKSQIYYPLIGDCAYRYNRLAKETFFSDRVACILFIKAYSYLRKHNQEYLPILDELTQTAKAYSNKN